MSQDFIGAAQAVKAACDTKPILPILAQACVRDDDGKTTISATNLGFSLRYRFAASGDPLNFTFPIKPFLATAPKLFNPQERLDITVDPRTLKVTFSQGPHHYSLVGFPAEEYPQFPDANDFSVTALLNPQDFKRDLAFVLPAASQNETRPILTGVSFRTNGKVLELATADGYRLHKAMCPTEIVDSSWYVWPAAMLGDMLKILPAAETLRMSYKRNVTEPHDVLRIDCGPLTAILSGIDGKFPDYELIIPRSHTASVTCQAADLLSALQAVYPLAYRSGDDAVNLRDFTPDTFSLYVKTMEEEISTTVPIVSATRLIAPTIWLNAAYLVAAIKELARMAKTLAISPVIQLEFNGLTAPVVIRLPETPALCVVMPMNKH
jgi:DNA polymerase-3 subunit beta